MSHDIYNPWHGCHKISAGCENCYMYFLDEKHDRDPTVVTKAKNFKYPLRRTREKKYKIQSGERIRVCMTSDFFIEEADPWRPEVWTMLKFRSDVIWTLLTKRHERIARCLPPDWGDGYENVQLGVTAENEEMAKARVPALLSVPAKHKYVMCAPLIGPVNLTPFLRTGQIEYVLAGGENYAGCRKCHYDWALFLYQQCRSTGVEFNFIETGTRFVMNGQEYRIRDKTSQAEQAFLSGLYCPPATRPEYKLFVPGTDDPVPEDQLYRKQLCGPHCQTCAGRYTCNGCSQCGKCDSLRIR